MNWELSHRFDAEVLPIADRHYNRQKPGTPQFMPTGSCLVLKLVHNGSVVALWGTSAPLAEWTKHEWAGAWMCSVFRNESGFLSSELIRQAVAVTRWHYGPVPALGMVTFVDREKVKPKQNPGYCYLRDGFEVCGETKGGLLALQLLEGGMREPQAPRRAHQLSKCTGLFAKVAS